MLRRSNPPGPLGPTAAHLSASTFMLHTLTSRGVLLSVATSVGILALYAFKKMYHLKTRTRGPVKRAPGMSSLFCASARMLLPAVSPYQAACALLPPMCSHSPSQRPALHAALPLGTGEG